MPTYHTGSVRYHVSEFLSDRHPYNPSTGFPTQRQREAGLVKNSHESVALDKLQEDLVTLDDPNEKVKALRAIIAHASAAEIKIVLLRKGIAARAAATLMQARKMTLAISSSQQDDPNTIAADPMPDAAAHLQHIQQLEAFKTPALLPAWCLVEQSAAQLLRSLAVIPQGVHVVIEEGGWSALIASVADTTLGLKERESARVCAATAIALLTSTGASLNWISAGSIDAPKDMELEGYSPWEAFYEGGELFHLYNFDDDNMGAKKAASSSSAAVLSSPQAIGTQRLDSIDSREKVISAFFDTVVASLAKDIPSPRLIVSLLDGVGNLLKLERCLHLALIASLLRGLSSYVGAVLLQDDLWIHSGGGNNNANGGVAGTIKAADKNTATLASATSDHKMPGSAPVNAATHVPSSAQIDIAVKILNILWHIGLDSVGKQEILELYQIVFQTGQLLQMLLSATPSTGLLNVKALVAGALGSMALLPDMKKMMTAKKDLKIVIVKHEETGSTENPPLSGNRDANGLSESFLDSLLTLLRQANELMRTKFPRPSADASVPQPRLSIADTSLKRDLDAVITNTVAAIRLICELPAARAYLHSTVFFTNSPPVNVDGPALTIAAAQEGKEHELRRQLFFSSRWEKEFKVYVY